MPFWSKTLTLPYEVLDRLLRRMMSAKPAIKLPPLVSEKTLNLPFDIADKTLRFGLKHPIMVGGGAIAANDAWNRAKGLEASIRSNRMGLPYAKYSSLNNFEQTKEYLSEKVAFEKTALAAGDFMNVDDLLGGVGSGLGKGLAEAGLSQIGKIIGGTARAIKERLILSSKREEILDSIIQNDPIVSVFEKESPGSTIKAYSTMVKIAPTLSTDPNIAISFLRNAAQTGGTMDFATVKLLADAESAVTKARTPEGRWTLREK